MFHAQTFTNLVRIELVVEFFIADWPSMNNDADKGWVGVPKTVLAIYVVVKKRVNTDDLVTARDFTIYIGKIFIHNALFRLNLSSFDLKVKANVQFSPLGSLNFATDIFTVTFKDSLLVQYR